MQNWKTVRESIEIFHSLLRTVNHFKTLWKFFSTHCSFEVTHYHNILHYWQCWETNERTHAVLKWYLASLALVCYLTLMVFWKKKKTICNGSDSWETMFSTSINFIVNAKARNNVSNEVLQRTLIQEKKSHGHQFASFRFVSWQLFLILFAIFPIITCWHAIYFLKNELEIKIWSLIDKRSTRYTHYSRNNCVALKLCLCSPVCVW